MCVFASFYSVGWLIWVQFEKKKLSAYFQHVALLYTVAPQCPLNYFFIWLVVAICLNAKRSLSLTFTPVLIDAIE